MSSSAAEKPTSSIPLTDLARGEKGRVTSVAGESAICNRLREMGFCESAIVEKMSGSHTVLCQVCGTRVALNGRIAQNVLVEPLPANPDAAP